LCGGVHRLRIHVVVARKVRTEEERNTQILIVGIYCGRARRRGAPYTRRILPAFVIPRCTITLENVLHYVLEHPEEGKIDYDEASYLLGSYDSRTIRKHIEGAWGMLREARGCPSEQPGETAELIEVLHALYVRRGEDCRVADSTLGRACRAPPGCDTS
jgi:hypothetical protein